MGWRLGLEIPRSRREQGCAAIASPPIRNVEEEGDLTGSAATPIPCPYSPSACRVIISGQEENRQPYAPTETLAYPSVSMALRYCASAENFLQIENKLSHLKEVTQKTWGQTIFLLRLTYHVAVTVRFSYQYRARFNAHHRCAALPSASAAVCVRWVCIHWRTLLLLSLMFNYCYMYV